jgi:hypothetical protein
MRIKADYEKIVLYLEGVVVFVIFNIVLISSIQRSEASIIDNIDIICIVSVKL